MNAITYTAAAAVTKASNAESAIGGLWADAYAGAARDIDAGGNLRDMAAAITRAGVKCSKDTAGDYVMAHALTIHGSVFDDALAARIGEGRVMRAHSLIAKARKARGVAYVRAVLATLDVDDDDALAKAMTKAVKDLDAAKREPKSPNGGDGETGDGGTGETGEGETVETVVPTVDAMLAAVVGPTAKLAEAVNAGDMPTDLAALDRWLTAVGTIARARKAMRDAA